MRIKLYDMNKYEKFQSIEAYRVTMYKFTAHNKGSSILESKIVNTSTMSNTCILYTNFETYPQAVVELAIEMHKTNCKTCYPKIKEIK